MEAKMRIKQLFRTYKTTLSGNENLRFWKTQYNANYRFGIVLKQKKHNSNVSISVGFEGDLIENTSKNAHPPDHQQFQGTLSLEGNSFKNVYLIARKNNKNDHYNLITFFPVSEQEGAHNNSLKPLLDIAMQSEPYAPEDVVEKFHPVFLKNPGGSASVIIDDMLKEEHKLKEQAQKREEEERRQKEQAQKREEEVRKQNKELLAKLKLKTSEEQFAAQEIENAQKLNQKLKYSDPYKLIEVNRDIKRGSGACTQLVFANGDTRYILVQNYDRDLKVTQKAESLRGKNVKVSTWMGGDKDYSSTYFNNIYETNEVASSNQIIPNIDPRIINKISPRSLKIRSVSLVPGTKFQPNWRKEMYEIETDIGIFIAPTIKSQQENVQGFYVNWNNEVGKILQVWSSKGMGYYWLHLCSPPKSAGSSLDDEIPF
ncbi:hypothetical protein N9M73_01270 [Rhodobacteraceae bacterium]|nr:hypothetical protein [Paracoccaceae bacterium]